jgi:hypothetical protein
MDPFVDSGVREDAPFYQLWAKVATVSYFHAVKSFYFLQMLSAVPLPQAVAVFEDVAHSALSRLVELSISAPLRDEELLGRELTVRATRFASAVYEERLETTPKREPGIFSLIEPHEIVPLAGRESAMAKKYGDKKIARVLEQRLAIVFQSLGFYVVSARTGERTVDLVCIAADPGAGYTLLVEAKSTKRTYGLPVADERALRDYAATVKELLKTLPPLRAVVVVARAPARTLDQKLTRLEASAGVPARFASAKSLVNLREELPGAAPSAALLEALLQGPRILPDDWGRAAVQRYRDEQQAHETFVRTMFGLDRPG